MSHDSCRYHDFIQRIDAPDAIVEDCKICGERVCYWKRDGRIDNTKYLRDHIRDFCQPEGPTSRIYAEIYGEGARKRSLAIRRMKADAGRKKEEQFEEGLASTKEALRYWSKASGKGFTDKEILKAIQDSK